jgi:isoquinoline 1-oxidoreductase beta subunit
MNPREANTIDRRRFLVVTAAAGGALLVGLHADDASAKTRKHAKPPPAAAPVRPNELAAWIRINRDNTIEIAIPRQEMGQGVSTSLMMLLVDELDGDVARVTTYQAEANQKYGPQGTGGSQSIKQSWVPLREAAATARAMLLQAASLTLKVPVQDLTVDKGVITHAPSRRSLRYGELAAAAASLPKPENVATKSKEQRKLIGKPMRKRETRDVVRGVQLYGIDFKLPGMLVGMIERTPVPGARPRYDAAAAMRIAGVVKIFEVPAVADKPLFIRGGVAVLARDTWSAMQARHALNVTWDGGNANEESTLVAAKQAEAVQRPGAQFASFGDIDGALTIPDLVAVAAEYEMPMLAHATMEPMNCTVQINKDGTVQGWGPSQNPVRAQQTIAKLLGLDQAKVTFQPLVMGGGLGRRSNSDFAGEAALLARQADGAPVKLLWTREDDFRFDHYHPMTRAKVEAWTTKDGSLVAWRHHLASTPVGSMFALAPGTSPAAFESAGIGDGFLYDAPNASFRFSGVETATPRWWWRGVSWVYNVFAVESAIDELANALNQDPLAYREQLLSRTKQVTRVQKHARGDEEIVLDHARMTKVMQEATQRIGWNYRPGPGRGMGLAVYEYDGSYAAIAAEIAVDAKAGMQVKRIVAAADVGTIVNPLALEAQIVGGVIFGLSSSLRERITIEKGRVAQANYGDYEVARMPDIPPIEVILLENGAAPTGAGELAVPGVAPALANAIFAATEIRVRKTPFYAARPELKPAV